MKTLQELELQLVEQEQDLQRTRDAIQVAKDRDVWLEDTSINPIEVSINPQGSLAIKGKACNLSLVILKRNVPSFIKWVTELQESLT